MNPKKRTLGAIAAFALAIALNTSHQVYAAEAAGLPGLRDLRCELQSSPLGIDTPKPRLSWKLDDNRRGARQTAYQVVVAETAEALHAGKDLLWDTGKVASNQTIHFAYGGKPLVSWQRYWWKVRAWDMNGEASAWSEPGWWETAALSPKDWKADWIVMKHQPTHKKDGEKDDLGDWLYAANLKPFVYGHQYTEVHQHFRKDVDFPDNVAITAARLLVDTKNPCKIWINGQVIVDELSGRKPAPTAIVITDAQAECRRQSDSRSRMQTFDAAPFLRKGKNTLAVELLQEPDIPTSAFRGVMVCTLASGERLAVLTDTTWRVRSTADDGQWSPRFSKEDSERWFLPDWIATKKEPERWSSATSTGDIHPLDYRRAALFRKQFIVKPGIASARIYASALGVYEVFINGQRVGRDELTPGRSSLSNEPCWKKGREHLVQYQVYDVTHLLKEGENVMAAQVCNGWWNGGLRNIDCHPPAWFAELVVRHGKGETQWVRTDGSWKSSPSPVVFDALGWGETYDARLEQPGWNAPGFDDHNWAAVRTQKFEPAPELISQIGPPCRVTETLPPIAIRRQGDAYTVDFAQILSGWCRLTIHNAPPGTVLRLKSTHIHEKGIDEYICRGTASETWRVRSRYNTFQSVVLTGFPGELKPDQIAMEVVHDDLPEAGTFTCSNEVVNRLWRGIRRTLRGNLQTVVQDCAREKQLWGGEVQGCNRVMCWMMDSAAYNARFVRLFGGGYTMGGAPAWDDSIFTHAWNSFVLYGDTSVAERAYGEMQLIADQRAKSQDGVYFSAQFEDWFAVESAKNGMAGAFWQYLSTQRLSRLAEALGQEEDASRYAKMLPPIAEGFNRKFLDRTQAVYDGNLQKSYALPVYLGIVPDDLWSRISEKLERSVAALDQEMAARNPKRHEELKKSNPVGYSLDDHPTVAPHAAPFLLHALTSAGHHETAYRMLTQETRPSWGYMVADDRSGMCEHYNRGGSHTGHCSIGDWIFETLGGIRADARYPGLTRFIVKPQPAGDLKAAKATYESLHGRIESDWRRDEDGTFSLRLTVPPNTEALVYLPVSSGGKAAITEGGLPVAKAPGVHSVSMNELPSLQRGDAQGHQSKDEQALFAQQARAFRVEAGSFDFRVAH